MSSSHQETVTEVGAPTRPRRSMAASSTVSGSAGVAGGCGAGAETITTPSPSAHRSRSGRRVPRHHGRWRPVPGGSLAAGLPHRPLGLGSGGDGQSARCSPHRRLDAPERERYEITAGGARAGIAEYRLQSDLQIPDWRRRGGAAILPGCRTSHQPLLIGWDIDLSPHRRMLIT